MASERNNLNPAGGSFDELLLVRYLDGRLNEKDRAAAEELLRSNAAARRMYDALREEDSLLHAALEPRAEPAKPIGDKVLATLYNEERFRINAQRNRRLRRQVLTAVAIAASFVLCVMLVKPRDAAGTTISGTLAAMVTASGEPRQLKKETNVYEGDQVSTALGQFVRIRLAGGGYLDLDENSRLSFDQNADLNGLKFSEGRIGLDLRDATEDLMVRLPQGSVRVMSGARVDLWLPQPVQMQWPELLLPLQDNTVADTAAGTRPAAITVFDGTVYVANEKLPTGAAIGKGNRVLLTASRREVRRADPGSSQVLDTRNERSWHALDNVAPQGRTVIGLTEAQNFVEFGNRLGVAAISEKIKDALKLLQEGQQERDALARAEKLAAGQQELRAAFEPLRQNEEHLRMGRMLEGFAHFARGDALRQAQRDDSANVAYLAAQVAFDEAIPTLQPNSKPSWARRLATESALKLREFSPADQSALLATFMHPVAKYWQAATMAPDATRADLAGEAAKRFAAIRADLGRGAEGLLVRFGEGLCLGLANRGDKAAEAYQEVLSASDAGCEELPRQWINGIKQAALLASARMHTAAGDIAKAAAAAHDFWLLYPLNTTSPAAQQIDRVLNDKALKAADEALSKGQYAQALELYDTALSGPARNDVSLRLKFIRAVIGAKFGERARRELAALAPQVPAEQKAEFDKLQQQAEALPDKPDTK